MQDAEAMIAGLQADYVNTLWPESLVPIEAESSVITEQSLALLFYHDPQALRDIAYGLERKTSPQVKHGICSLPTSSYAVP
jgi:hypothetical protein